MFNVQCSKFNECSSNQCINALNNCVIDNSLTIDNCKLIIAPTVGGAL